jgi:hypothetical protein
MVDHPLATKQETGATFIKDLKNRRRRQNKNKAIREGEFGASRRYCGYESDRFLLLLLIYK